jgi:hypothetical protein
VNAALVGETVLVDSGVYDSGTSVTPGYASLNRVVITKDITVISAHGADQTFIKGKRSSGGGIGSDAVRCVYMTAGTLSDFTITNGFTAGSGDLYHDQSGGGINAWNADAVIDNCIISGNAANELGGGCLAGTIVNSHIMNNSAKSGGGVEHASLCDCVVNGNTAYSGGGCARSSLTNSAVSGNAAEYGGGCYYGSVSGCVLSKNTAGISGGGSYVSTVTREQSFIRRRVLYGGTEWLHT